MRARVGGAFALMIVAAMVFVNVAPNTWEVQIRPRALHGLALGLVLASAILMIANPSPFLYFQF